MSRALKLSSQYPNELFAFASTPGWMITSYERKKREESYIWLMNGEVLPSKPDQISPDAPTVTVYRMGEDEGYPRWRKDSSYVYRSLYEAVQYCQKHNGLLMLKIKNGNKTYARFWHGKKEVDNTYVVKWKAAKTVHTDEINASWYPQDFDWYNMPAFKLEKWRDQRGYTAEDFWKRQLDLVHDINIHLEHATLTLKERNELELYRDVILSFTGLTPEKPVV